MISHCVRIHFAGLWIGLAIVSLLQPTNSWAADRDQLVKSLLEQVKVKRGVCLVLGRDGAVAIDLATESELLFAVREPDATQAGELRKLADQSGLGMQRLVVIRAVTLGFRLRTTSSMPLLRRRLATRC